MKKILYSIVAFLSVFLFMTGCTDTETLMDDPSDRIVTFSANIRTSKNSTRAELSQDYHSLDLNTYWEDGDELQIFVEQNRKVYEVGMVGISNISDDGKKASFSFQLPKEVDMNKYVKMYAFCGIEGELEQNYDGSWFASCQVDLTRSALVHFRAPMYCETMLEDVKNPDLVLFWHFGTYEVLHVENTSGSSISFNHYGYQVEVPWYQGSTHLRFDEEFQTTVLDGAWRGEAQSEGVNIPSGHTEEIISWYMPSGYMMHDAYLKGYINNKLIISSNKKSSNVKIEPGHAYHLYVNWDGKILTFKDGDEEPERIINVTPATIKFGPVVVGETKSADFVVSNEGEGDLTFQVESTHGLFDIPESGKTFKLGEGEKKQFTVTFTPTEAGKECSHTVAITSDAINGTKYVNITASTEEKPVNKAIIKLVPDEIDFGTVIVGESKTAQFKVSNDGNADLTFKVRNTQGDFTIAESGEGFTLSPGKNKIFTVTFTPTEANKDYNQNVEIISNADNETPILKLKGASKEAERIDRVIPKDMRDTMEPYIKIYDGDNPPNVEGVYLISPAKLFYDSSGYEDDNWADLLLHFFNQNKANNTIDYEEMNEGYSEGSGSGAFISGTGEKFSIFFNISQVNHIDGHDVYTKSALVISGIKTKEGIKDIEYAFILVDKSGDTTNRIMDVGDFRVFIDGDGMASNSTWPSDTRAVKVNGDSKLSLFTVPVRP